MLITRIHSHPRNSSEIADSCWIFNKCRSTTCVHRKSPIRIDNYRNLLDPYSQSGHDKHIIRVVGRCRNRWKITNPEKNIISLLLLNFSIITITRTRQNINILTDRLRRFQLWSRWLTCKKEKNNIKNRPFSVRRKSFSNTAINNS